MIKANVYVTLKESILDPQGTAVRKALHNLDYKNVHNIRVGKLIQVEINDTDKNAAETQLNEMCQKLLSNPVIENYSYQIEG